MAPGLQLGWFSTGRDRAARELLEAVYRNIRSGEIKADISFAFCSREPGESAESDRFLKQVNSYSIPSVCLSYRKLKANRATSVRKHFALPEWRLEYDREVMKRLDGFHADLCVLAGYMLIVSPEMCQRYQMLNLHPAAPGGPTGTWQKVIWQLIEAKAEKTGVMMHLVTPELDKGPPVTFCTFPIRGEPFDRYWRQIDRMDIEEVKRQQDEKNALFRLIRRHGLAREFPLIIATLKAFGEGRISISPDKQILDSTGKPIQGYDLTEEIGHSLTKEVR